MKTLNQYTKEKLIINKDYNGINILAPRTFDELKEIIDDRDDKLGPGTKENPIDFNDIDISHIRSFYNDDGHKGLFDDTFFKYIDISGWDVSNVTNMRCMFFSCEGLKSVGDISGWNVSNVTDMAYMFCDCYYLNQDISDWDVSNVTNMRCMFFDCGELKSVGDLSNWDVSNVTDMSGMFYECNELKFIGDISNWDVSNVTNMCSMFDECKSFNQDLSCWNVSNVIYKDSIFYNCPIKEEYKPKFK